MPAARHGLVEADVRHHGADDGVVGQLAAVVEQGHGQDRQDRVAVDVGAVGGDGQTAVGVAVVRDAQVGPVLEDSGPQHVEVGRADPVVDVEAVGIAGDRR